MNRLIIPSHLREQVDEHLDAGDQQEEGLFLLGRTGMTAAGVRLLAFDALLPKEGDWERQGPSELAPSGRWLSAAISHAVAANASLILVHSHPHPWHPADLSPVDLKTFRRLAPVIEDVTGYPFAMVAVSSRGWSGSVSRAGLPRQLDRIDAIGPGLHPLAPPSGAEDTLLDSRQILAIGESNRDLRSLSVAVVGCGGTGSAVAEQLYRMGVMRLGLVDHDILDTDSNLRRVTGARHADARMTPVPSKVKIVASHLASIGLPDIEVSAICGDVTDEAIARQLLDFDVIVGATDTHTSRGLLNDLAYAYGLPVIDVGARVAAPDGVLEGLIIDRRLLMPGRPCLWCTGEIRQDVIRAENLDPEARRALASEGYVVGTLHEPQASIVALNALAAAAASCAIPALIGEGAKCLPDRTVFDAVFGDAWSSSPATQDECRCAAVLLEADAAPIGFRKGV